MIPRKPKHNGTGAGCDFLTLEQVANLLQLHYNTVYRLVQAHRLKALRVSRQLRVKRTDLQAFIDRNTH